MLSRMLSLAALAGELLLAGDVGRRLIGASWIGSDRDGMEWDAIQMGREDGDEDGDGDRDRDGYEDGVRGDDGDGGRCGMGR